MSLYSRLYHLIIGFFGCSTLKNGSGIIPCKRCGEKFVSYCHYEGGWGSHDIYCYDCAIMIGAGVFDRGKTKC